MWAGCQLHLWTGLSNMAACNSWGWSPRPRRTPVGSGLTCPVLVGGSPRRLSKHSPRSLCGDRPAEKKLIPASFIHTSEIRKNYKCCNKAVSLVRYIYSLCTLPLAFYFGAYMNRHSRQGEEMESLLCLCSTPLFLTSAHFYTGAGGICALCTFLGSKYIVHLIRAATTLKHWCAPKSVLFILGESPFCFGLCFCFSWSCMTLHSFSKDKITDYAL